MSFIYFFTDSRLLKCDDQPLATIFGMGFRVPTWLLLRSCRSEYDDAGVTNRDKILQVASDSRFFEVVSSVSARYNSLSLSKISINSVSIV